MQSASAVTVGHATTEEASRPKLSTGKEQKPEIPKALNESLTGRCDSSLTP